jgi:hypothetical protein
MARSLYSIKGTLFTSTARTEKTQGELYDEIRSLPGVVTLNTKTLGSGTGTGKVQLEAERQKLILEIENG